MSYSLSFSQAVTLLVYIAVKMQLGNSAKYLSTKYIAEKLAIPIPTLAKVIKNLLLSGLIDTKEGANGGITLAKRPNEISLLDIFLAVEGNRSLFKSIKLTNFNHGDFDYYQNKLNDTFMAPELAMKSELRKITVDDLLKKADE